MHIFIVPVPSLSWQLQLIINLTQCILDVPMPWCRYSFEGLYSVTINGYQHQDSTPYRCLDSAEENAQPLATVLHLNCSQPNCAVNGLSISGAGFQSGPAVRVRNLT